MPSCHHPKRQFGDRPSMIACRCSYQRSSFVCSCRFGPSNYRLPIGRHVGEGVIGKLHIALLDRFLGARPLLRLEWTGGQQDQRQNPNIAHGSRPPSLFLKNPQEVSREVAGYRSQQTKSIIWSPQSEQRATYRLKRIRPPVTLAGQERRRVSNALHASIPASSCHSAPHSPSENDGRA